MKLYDRHQATPKGLTEIGRTMRSKTFDLGSGKRKCVQTIGPLHWQDADGLKDIDLMPVEQPDGMLRVDQCAYKLIVDPATATLRHESRELGTRARVGLKAVGNRPVVSLSMRPVIEDGKITWPQVVPGVDIELVLRPNGAEWFKIIHDARAPHEFTWSVERQEGFPAERIKLQTQGVDANRDKLRMSHRQGPKREVLGWEKFDLTERFERQVSRIVDKRTRRREFKDDVAYPVRVDQAITESIAAGADDVRSGNYGTVTTPYWAPSSTNISIGATTSFAFTYGAGFRFTSVALPQGATIDQALLKLTIQGGDGVPNFALFGVDVDDAGAWHSTSNRPADVTKTTASTAVDISGSGGDVKSQDVTSIVQEIANRAGWASGADMAFVAAPTGAVSGTFGGIAASEHATFDGPVLEIDYTEVSGPTKGALYHHYRQMHGA